MQQIIINNKHAHEVTRKAIGLAVYKNRAKVIALLKKYGVTVDNSYSEDELLVGVLAALRTNHFFKQDLKKLLEETTATHVGFTGGKGMQFFFTGSDGQHFFGQDGIPDWFPTTKKGADALMTDIEKSKTAATKEKTAAGAWLQSNMGNIFNTGLATISTVITNKSNNKLADKALQIEVEKTKQAALIGSAAKPGSPGKSGGLSTGTKILIGVGVVAALGTVIYFIVRKK